MVLIVDDKPENIISLKKLLSIHGFAVDTALSGEEALKKVLKNAYFLIILDVHMPGMDGFEVAEALAGYSKAKDIPIIFLSAANTNKKFISKGYNSGGLDYITKPFDPDILILKVKTNYKLYEQTCELKSIQNALQEEIKIRKQAQSKLREKNMELHSILATIPQIAFTTNEKGTIEFVNQRWFKYATSISGFPEVHPDDEDIYKKWNDTILSGCSMEMELRICTLDEKKWQWHLLRVIPVKEGDIISKWVGTFTNIEEQKLAEHKKTEFISIASHELKTPLTSIKAYVELLDKSITTQSLENTQRFLNRTKVQVNKLCNLTADLLDISKIESGKFKFNKKFFDFEKLLNNSIEIIQQTYTDYKIIKKSTAPVQIYGDEVRLEQVIVNYLSNAIKYSPDNKEVFIETVVTPEKKLYVAVKDQGIGISDQDHSNIFSKFYRVKDSSQRFNGLGIGLYICAEILKRHNSDFGVVSELGKGATFYFSLPLSNC